MPHVSKGRSSRNNSSGYDPSEEGYDSDQAEEIRAWNDWESAEKRFFEEDESD